MLRHNKVRSPCPAINSLANHNILPHSGKGITKAMAVEALTKSFNIDPKIANVFAASGIIANPNHDAHSFDLNHVNKHNYIEHDGSLSRGDAAFGDGVKFDQQAFDMVLKVYREAHPGKSDDEIMTDWGTAAHARWARITASKEEHEKEEKTWIYGIKEAIMSYGETSLCLNLLGKDGVAPLQWVKIFFGKLALGKYREFICLLEEQNKNEFRMLRDGDHQRSSIKRILTMGTRR